MDFKWFICLKLPVQAKLESLENFTTNYEQTLQ